MVRSYFPVGSWAFFPDLSYYYGWQIVNGPTFSPTTGTVSDTKTTSKLGMFKAGVGANYFLTKNIGLEGVLSYQDYTNKNSQTYNMNASSIIFRVGLQIYFSKTNK